MIHPVRLLLRGSSIYCCIISFDTEKFKNSPDLCDKHLKSHSEAKKNKVTLVPLTMISVDINQNSWPIFYRLKNALDVVQILKFVILITVNKILDVFGLIAINF